MKDEYGFCPAQFLCTARVGGPPDPSLTAVKSQGEPGQLQDWTQTPIPPQEEGQGLSTQGTSCSPTHSMSTKYISVYPHNTPLPTPTLDDP